MNPSHIIIAPPVGENPPPAVTTEGQRIKTELLALSGAFLTVTTDNIRDQAIELAGRIKGHIDQVEKDREAVKAPYLKICQAIDLAKRQHVSSLEIELSRINRLTGKYEADQREKLRREQEARDAEVRRIEQEKVAVIKEQQRLAEEQRKKEEALAAKGREPTPAQKARALEAQLELEEQEAEARRKGDELLALRTREAEEARRTQATGGALRHDLDVVVTDVRALYAAHPALCILKGDIVGIKYFINHYLKEGEIIPGVRFTKTPIYSAKAR